MANRAGEAILALAAALTLGGCGTIGNLAGKDDTIYPLSPEARVYGGVGADVNLFNMGRQPPGVIYPWLRPVFVSFALLDLPLSAVGDTLTLPLTAYATWKRLTAEATRHTPSSEHPPRD